jgi:hypothetical protein
MPYIEQNKRNYIDPLIEPIIQRVGVMDKGNINYIITRIVAAKYANGGYEKRSTGAGVLQDAHDEYYRRVVAPYEDQKLQENGDVY